MGLALFFNIRYPQAQSNNRFNDSASKLAGHEDKANAF